MVDGEGKASADGDIRMTVRKRAKRKPVRIFSGGYWVEHEYDAFGCISFRYTKILWWRKSK